MGFKIEETFQVPAAASRVWEFLADPHQVVQCLPGAELTEALDENTFTGRVRVKVGPVTASYKGKATFVERDAERRLVRLVGEAQETGGGGSAKMTMLSQLNELPDGRTEVRVDAELEVVGRIVQFGRGMIEEVNRQLFRQFATCTQARLAQPAEEEPAAAARAKEGATPAAAPGEATQPPPQAAPPNAASGPPPASQPLRAIPLLAQAIRGVIGRFFAGLFRRKG